MARVKSASATVRKRKPARLKRRSGTIPRPTGEMALAMFAHEIRTALTGILALGELLSTADLGPREREWAAAARSSAEHLNALTTLIVDAAKAKASRLVLRADRFRPRLFAEAVGLSLSARAEAKGLSATVAIAGDLPDFVRGDAVRLRAALENLVDNAVKFTDRGSVGLTVNAEPAPGRRARLVFVVSDTGPGLDRAALRRLFRPYAQAGAEIASRYGGSGLGLASVKRLAKAMGGDLMVTSRPGEGSQFHLSVVVARAKAATRGKLLDILCVESNPFGRVILDTVLTELGHRATFVGSGAGAADLLKRDAFDAVVVDISPDTDGAAAVRGIRALPGAAGDLPIIGMAGGHTPSQQPATMGIAAILRKPITPQALTEALVAAMRRSR
jgi:CheY-like chemotaxis protein